MEKTTNAHTETNFIMKPKGLPEIHKLKIWKQVQINQNDYSSFSKFTKCQATTKWEKENPQKKPTNRNGRSKQWAREPYLCRQKQKRLPRGREEES